MSNRLEVKVEGSASGFKQTMDSVRTQAKGAADAISHSWGAGLFGGITAGLSIGAITASLQSFISNAKGIKDMAEQLEMSTDATQKWAKAADDVGASMENVYSVLSAIQSKRQEALRDPRAADLFSGMGISRDQVLNENNSEFAKRVLTAGGASDENRGLLEQIIGRRGLKLISAASRYAGETPDLGSDAIKAADDADKAKKKVDSFIGRQWGMIIENYAHLIDFAKGDLSFKDWWGKGIYLFGHKFQRGGAQAPQQQAGSIGSIVAGAVAATAAPGATDDPLEGIKNQQGMEYRLRQMEAQYSLNEANRKNMTIAGRKKSIKADMEDLNIEIDARGKSADLGLIYGMTQEQQSHMLKTDIEKQLQADMITLTGLQTQEAGWKNQLRDSKGFNFNADNLARVGLYSGSTLAINPIVQLTQKQISVLEKIEHNTSHHHNPHQR